MVIVTYSISVFFEPRFCTYYIICPIYSYTTLYSTLTTYISMSSFSDYDEISPEEQLKIAKHYLLSSPPGQFTEVRYE